MKRHNGLLYAGVGFVYRAKDTANEFVGFAMMGAPLVDGHGLLQQMFLKVKLKKYDLTK